MCQPLPGACACRVRHEAGEALGAIGTEECLVPLREHLNDDVLEVGRLLRGPTAPADVGCQHLAVNLGRLCADAGGRSVLQSCTIALMAHRHDAVDAGLVRSPSARASFYRM